MDHIHRFTSDPGKPPADGPMIDAGDIEPLSLGTTRTRLGTILDEMKYTEDREFDRVRERLRTILHRMSRDDMPLNDLLSFCDHVRRLEADYRSCEASQVQPGGWVKRKHRSKKAPKRLLKTMQTLAEHLEHMFPDSLKLNLDDRKSLGDVVAKVSETVVDCNPPAERIAKAAQPIEDERGAKTVTAHKDLEPGEPREKSAVSVEEKPQLRETEWWTTSSEAAESSEEEHLRSWLDDSTDSGEEQLQSWFDNSCDSETPPTTCNAATEVELAPLPATSDEAVEVESLVPPTRNEDLSSGIYRRMLTTDGEWIKGKTQLQGYEDIENHQRPATKAYDPDNLEMEDADNYPQTFFAEEESTIGSFAKMKLETARKDLRTRLGREGREVMMMPEEERLPAENSCCATSSGETAGLGHTLLPTRNDDTAKIETQLQRSLSDVSQKHNHERVQGTTSPESSGGVSIDRHVSFKIVDRSIGIVAEVNLSDVETQNPHPPSCARRTWIRCQHVLEKGLPLPVAWWPFDPPELTYNGDSVAQSQRIPLQLPLDAMADAVSSETTSEGWSSSATGIAGQTPSITSESDGISKAAQDKETRTSPDTTNVNHESQYILLCFDVSKLRLRDGFRHECLLRQIQITDPTSDRQIFDSFRKEFYSITGSIRRCISLRMLARIEFVKSKS
ncbi:hypothetical protein BZA05DRAFT_114080 [Tricharina praecox]|uniref:uncharacterized protein n=1 Tax=Tricharina praecox TaxID=43433 RepID=UPI00221E6A90|nr:uncharacterized protein BZA05DRAFT_114080 [Tricharina praecox]KAI5858057.1 hypothetical protein BZA05DRAFT_114080 [Tricharina praecox]